MLRCNNIHFLKIDHILIYSVINNTNAPQVYFSHLNHSSGRESMNTHWAPGTILDSGAEAVNKITTLERVLRGIQHSSIPREAYEVQREVFIQKYLHKGNLLR